MMKEERIWQEEHHIKERGSICKNILLLVSFVFFPSPKWLPKSNKIINNKIIIIKYWKRIKIQKAINEEEREDGRGNRITDLVSNFEIIIIFFYLFINQFTFASFKVNLSPFLSPSLYSPSLPLFSFFLRSSLSSFSLLSLFLSPLYFLFFSIYFSLSLF